jgi:hypothetical protein
LEQRMISFAVKPKTPIRFYPLSGQILYLTSEVTAQTAWRKGPFPPG